MAPSDPDHPFWPAVRGEVPPPECAKLLGWKVIEAEPDSGRVVIEFEAKPEFTNPLGNIQGGFITAMLDDAMGPAIATTYGTGEFSTTLELKVSFVRAARPGRYVATASVVHRGKSVAFLEGELRDIEGNLIATATSTARMIRPEAGQYWTASDR
jgi:uncharacterized protein (TIGR00369 family)